MHNVTIIIPFVHFTVILRCYNEAYIIAIIGNYYRNWYPAGMVL